MSDRTADAVPEADYIEQHIPAYPDRDSDQLEDADTEIDAVPAGDSGWTASEGDLVEQAIAVPMDDYDEPGSEE
ncbi:hypothetical protein [Nocardia sp. NPDC020380]|uniref:hypothetical protein n=1 Tax=Nocardia sp. NPDC020380 TaxID=3364309 RepID=UPI00379136C0